MQEERGIAHSELILKKGWLFRRFQSNLWYNQSCDVNLSHKCIPCGFCSLSFSVCLKMSSKLCWGRRRWVIILLPSARIRFEFWTTGNELPSPGRSHNKWDAETLNLTLTREGFPHDVGLFGGLKSLTSLILLWIKGVSFERNCGAASVGEYKKVI